MVNKDDHVQGLPGGRSNVEKVSGMRKRSKACEVESNT